MICKVSWQILKKQNVHHNHALAWYIHHLIALSFSTTKLTPSQGCLSTLLANFKYVHTLLLTTASPVLWISRTYRELKLCTIWKTSLPAPFLQHWGHQFHSLPLWVWLFKILYVSEIISQCLHTLKIKLHTSNIYNFYLPILLL